MAECECKTCVAPKRHPGCHSECGAYLAWRAELDELKSHERMMKQEERFARHSKPVKEKRRK